MTRKGERKMKSNRILLLAAVAVGVLAAGLSGCGGQGSATEIVPDGRGEGNVPIGRVRSEAATTWSAFLTKQDGTTLSLAVAPNGDLVLDEPVAGEYTLTVSDTLGAYEEAVYVLDVEPIGPMIDVFMVPANAGAECTSLTVRLLGGSSVQVNKPTPILTSARGTGLAQLKPTVWLTGDIGYLDNQGRLVPTQTGEGTIEAELLGVRASATVSITN